MATKGKILVLVSSGHGLPLKDGKVYAGAGYYLIATIATAISLVVLLALTPIDALFDRRRERANPRS